MGEIFRFRKPVQMIAGALLLSVNLVSSALPLTGIREPVAFRVAIIGFIYEPIKDDGQASRQAEALLTNLLKLDARVRLVERELFQPALTGLGYQGAVNLSRDEAKRLGAAVGCDFFITGKAGTFARSERAGESHFESFIGVMSVDGRSGQLVVFDFLHEKAATAGQSLAQLNAKLAAQLPQWIERLSLWQSQRLHLTPARNTKELPEEIEELPEEGSLLAEGFKPPEFLNRVKPEYTSEADLADIIATVEAMVVFQASGAVGAVEIVRWAGFGLDDAAVQAVRQLKFKPALREGQPVSIRAPVRFNFRRSN